MKLLLDANLSYRLVKKLLDRSIDCLHVTRTGLPIPAKDLEIWQWAKEHDYVILSNDEDFYHYAGLFGFPPKVVLLRMGNQSTNNVLETVIKHREAIDGLYRSSEFGVLELF